MANKFYLKGKRKEHKTCKKLKEQGFDIAQRTAGSHSPFDVIAIKFSTSEIRLIQCKPDTLNSHQAQKIRNENINLNGLFNVSFSVI